MNFKTSLIGFTALIISFTQPAFAALTTFTDSTVFATAAPSLTMEDFSATLIAPNSVSACGSAITSTIASTCFALGGVAPGFSLNSYDTDPDIPNNNPVVLSVGFLGVADISVGPSAFVDNLVIDFTLPNTAVAFNLVTPNGAETLVIEVFDATGTSIGTTNVTGNTTGTFFGATAPEGISRITMVGANTEGELIANLQFGLTIAATPAAIPTINTVGMFILILLLLITSIVTTHRKNIN